MRTAAIIPAAGSGRRIGGVRKAFMPVGGRPMLQYSIDVFLGHPDVRTVVVALVAEDLAAAPAWLRDPRLTLVEGGVERADSVRNALRSLPDNT